jgi:Family of unknown function (DUF5898)
MNFCCMIGQKIPPPKAVRLTRALATLFGKAHEYYVIGILGHGSTSNVYQAIDSNGRVVAIKVYVNAPEDEDGMFNRGTFDKCAQASIRREKLRLERFYKCLHGQVHEVRLLGGMHCLVMPFFKPVMKASRGRLFLKIENVLLASFVANKLKYAEDNIRWRNVGLYCATRGETEQVILYDLADLEDLEADNASAMVKNHSNVLMNGRETEWENTANTFCNAVVDSAGRGVDLSCGS